MTFQSLSFWLLQCNFHGFTRILPLSLKQPFKLYSIFVLPFIHMPICNSITIFQLTGNASSSANFCIVATSKLRNISSKFDFIAKQSIFLPTSNFLWHYSPYLLTTVFLLFERICSIAERHKQISVDWDIRSTRETRNSIRFSSSSSFYYIRTLSLPIFQSCLSSWTSLYTRGRSDREG